MTSIRIVIFTLILTALPIPAFADTYYVTVWNGLADCTTVDPCMFDADEADVPVPGATPLATFEFSPDDALGGISWGTGSGIFNTYGDFIDAGQITEFSSSLDLATFLGTSMSVEGNRFASYFAISGWYTSPTDFTQTILHDDGASLYVDGSNVFKAPARATGQATAGPYSFVGGTHAFDLYYIAADGGPALLNIAMPNAGTIPEPATLTLVGVAVLGFGFIGLRRPRTKR